MTLWLSLLPTLASMTNRVCRSTNVAIFTTQDRLYFLPLFYISINLFGRALGRK
jgi:hypothetical protein